MNLEKDIIEKEIALIPIDIKVEVITNEIFDKGFSKDKITIRPVGTIKRPYQKDISAVTDYNLKNEFRQDKLILEVNREGIYDALPEGVFHNHPSESKSKRRTKEELIKDFQEGQEEEKNARNFFLPFETEFFLQRINIEEEERRSVLGFMNPQNQKMFFDFWGLPNIFNKEQLYILLKILPYSYFIKGNFILFGQTLKALLKKDILVNYSTLTKIEELDDDSIRLNSAVLDQNLIVSGSFQDGDLSITINILDIKKSEVELYLPLSNNDKIIDCMVDFFLPANVQIIKNIDILNSDRYFIPMDSKPEDQKIENICHLDFDTYICKII